MIDFISIVNDSCRTFPFLSLFPLSFCPLHPPSLPLCRLEQAENLDENQWNLLQITDRFFLAIINSFSEFPPQLRSVCHCLYQVGSFPTSDLMLLSGWVECVTVAYTLTSHWLSSILC